MIHFMLHKASVRFPYWLFSHFPAQDFLCHIFQSCIFTSCIFVPHFPVSHFPALQFCAEYSIHAFSSPAFFLVPNFHVSHFQSLLNFLPPNLGGLWADPAKSVALALTEILAFNTKTGVTWPWSRPLLPSFDIWGVGGRHATSFELWTAIIGPYMTSDVFQHSHWKCLCRCHFRVR